MWCSCVSGISPPRRSPIEVLDLDILLVVAQRPLHGAVVEVAVEAHGRVAAAAGVPAPAAPQLRASWASST